MGDSLRVTHINTTDVAGGAARSVYRLHGGLRAAGHDSRMLVGYKTVASPEIDGVLSGSLGKRLGNRLVSAFERMTGLQSLVPWPREFLNHRAVRSADIVHLHNVHGRYFPYALLPALSGRVPVIWTLHDMWALTGHCTYSYECERWLTGCGHCPLLSDYPGLSVDTTALLWRTKQRIYRRSDVTVVTPSHWLTDMVRRSPLLGRFSVHTIPHGLDTDVFTPMSKLAARQALGLPADARVVMFAAAALTWRRKGAAYLLQALQQLARAGTNNLQLVTVGAGSAIPAGTQMPYPVRHLGPIADDRVLATCYSAADVFVAPSLAESFGQVFCEAMACGTPCVAFRTTAVPEVVRHMETGYLAASQDAEDLSRGIGLLLQEDALRMRLGAQARRLVETEYTLELEVRRYVELYRVMHGERAHMHRELQTACSA